MASGPGWRQITPQQVQQPELYAPGARTGSNAGAPDPGTGSGTGAGSPTNAYGTPYATSRGPNSPVSPSAQSAFANRELVTPESPWTGLSPGTPRTNTGLDSKKGKEGLLSGAGYYEDFYKTHGGDLMNGTSSSEQLYAQGVDALNPYYDYAQKLAIKSINDAAAARGGFNSSHTMTNIGNTVANLRGQQAKEMAQLAQQSDQAKFARYDRSADMAGDAQRAMENRAVTAGNAYTNLADKQAGQVRGFYGDATRGMTDAQMAAIELQLKEAGLNQEQIKQVLDMGFSFGGLGAKGSK